jgi:PD-(D/E)XK nuclease superfamily
MTKSLLGQHTRTLGIGMPAGTFELAEGWVTSTPVGAIGHPDTLTIHGRYDMVVALDLSGFGLVDIKVCRANEAHLSLYQRQLFSCAFAIENATRITGCIGPIERMGLLMLELDTFVTIANSLAALVGPLEWMEVPRDDRVFLRFVAEVLGVLEQSIPPAPDRNCPWCAYRNLSDSSKRGV